MNAYTDALVRTLFPRSSGRSEAAGGSRVALASDGLDQSISVAAYRAVSAVSQVAARAGETLHRWQHRRATMHELSRLDDRLLRDIGLSRGDIRDVARSLAAKDTGTRPASERSLKA